MEICFGDIGTMPVVNGTIPKPPDTATDAEKLAWEKLDTRAKRMISSAVSIPVLENLVNCSTAACMWATLCSFYQQKSSENIYLLQSSFFNYKMHAGDSINTHVNKIMSMGNLLKEMGEPFTEKMLITKIICSLPVNYNSIIAAWANVDAQDQTVAKLKVRLLQMESVLALQSAESSGDAAFFTRSNNGRPSNTRSSHRSHDNSNDRSHDQHNDQHNRSSMRGKKPQHDHNTDYIRDLKSRTRCYNCGESDHWTAECTRPRQDRAKNSNHQQRSHRNNNNNNKRSEACVAATDQIASDCSPHPSGSDTESCAFMTVSRHSQALSVNLDKTAWFADSGATEHMTEHRD